MIGLERGPTRDDIEWAANFRALHSLLKLCENGEHAELLLSTCRNAYLTVNALFAELQILMGDARDPSALRGGCELMIQGADAVDIKDRFSHATQRIRQFEIKEAVWRDRDGIHKDIDEARGKLKKADLIAATRIDRLLRTTRTPDSNPGYGWDHELLAIDNSERPHLEPYFSALKQILNVLRLCADLGLYVANSIGVEGDQEAKPDLGDVPTASTTESASYVFEHARALADACGWAFDDAGGNVEFVFSSACRHPQNSATIEKMTLPQAMTSDAIRSAASDIGVMIREALYFAHWAMCRDFTPNVAKRPMPAPFEIELPASAPTPETGQVAPIKVKRIRCKTNESPNDSVRIAVAHLAVPLKHLNGRDLRLEKKASDIVERDVRKALQAAATEGCKAIVFPEYSIPSSMNKELMESAAQHGLVIIAGLDGKLLDNKLCDQAIVVIPGEKNAYFQRKQEPSLEEEAGDAFFRDGEIHLFSNSPIGDFAVVVCSDFLQLSTLQSWKLDAPLPEILFVVARNNYHDLYVKFAVADSVRLYACVVIANVNEDEGGANSMGSCVVVPKRKCQVEHGHSVPVKGEFLKALAVHDISLHAIRARSRGKPQGDYLAVPQSAKRS